MFNLLLSIFGTKCLEKEPERSEGSEAMTLPHERTRAVYYTHSFLRRLLDPAQTPRVPRKIREEAYRLLRHYPHGYELDMAAREVPGIFGRIDNEGTEI